MKPLSKFAIRPTQTGWDANVGGGVDATPWNLWDIADDQRQMRATTCVTECHTTAFEREDAVPRRSTMRTISAGALMRSGNQLPAPLEITV